jgi:hypothetical protein
MENSDYEYELIEMKFESRRLSPANVIEKSIFEVRLVSENLRTFIIQNTIRIPNSLFEDLAILVQEGKIDQIKSFSAYNSIRGSVIDSETLKN